ncbi:Leucine dehydrogenase [Pelagimonas phthalicica]|uniref:Leucine dehydrogenase n=1 Tax=Pelagimonas phthalicica TaxID=1037362 RepID=A0A238JG45_9RHOB|nr:Glu/Leu/Phe/Val dehydrogenase dimerization domain-containing protein [Pelagimonas phthalicica]TDS91882.1 leucine dehydrogenase [Pelagimonas phthalicica]SMX28932.1 Leucine dehydrogenase [Pelagimonas phthalicica]
MTLTAPTLTDLAVATHERVVHVEGLPGGLSALIAIHSTARGPAAGGLRMRSYDSFDAAVEDVLRLSHGMTLKNAAADLPLGGGKAVIMGDVATQKTPELMEAFGMAVDQLGGDYRTAEDMGMTPEDMAIISRQTKFVAGLPGKSGDPSPITARGVFLSMKVAAKHKFGSDDLNGKRVAMQGLGHVGWHLADMLHEAGAELIVTDVNEDALDEAVVSFNAKVVGLDEIYGQDVEIFAPCAIGAVLNAKTIPMLTCEVVCGAANNLLATPEDGQRLVERGILYAPDFVANGGGIINATPEIIGQTQDAAWLEGKLQALSNNMDAILSESLRSGLPPHEVAEHMVEAKVSLAA